LSPANDDRSEGHARAGASPILIAGVLAGCAVLLVLLRPLFGNDVYIEHDIGFYYLPVRWFYQRCLDAGHAFDWFPYWFNGFHLQGEGQGGLYHPFNWLLYRLLPLTLAFNLEVVRSYIALWLGSFLFLRRWSLSREGALVGALFIAFSGASLHHYFMLNVMAGFAHLPWLLLCIDVAARAMDRRRVVLATVCLGLLTGSQLLVSHPQVVWMSGLVEVAYLALLLRSGLRPRLLVRLAVAVLAGVGIGAVQLFPMIEMLAGSIRMDADLGAAGRFGALHPLDTFQLFTPYAFRRGAIGMAPLGQPISRGDLSIYAGALAPVLIVWLALRRGELGRERPLLIGAGVLAVVTLLLAMGDLGGLFHLQKAIPIVANFRTPARYGLLVHFALGIIVAIAFDRLLALRSRPGARRLSPVPGLFAVPVAAIAVAGVIYFGRSALGLPALSHGGWLFVGPALSLATVGLVLWSEGGRRLALVVLVLFAVADVGVYGLSFSQGHRHASPAELAAAFPRPPDYDNELRLVNLFSPLAMDEVRLVLGWGALLPRRIVHILGAKTPEERAVADAYIRLSSAGWTSEQAESRVENPLPRVRFVDRALVSDEPLRASTTIDLATTAVVDRPLGLVAGERGSASFVDEQPGAMRMRAHAPTRQLLVVSESYHEGWRALVDGVPAEVVPVHEYLIGVVVESGDHDVRLRFSATSTRVGGLVSLTSLMILLGWGSWDWRRAARASADPRARAGRSEAR